MKAVKKLPECASKPTGRVVPVQIGGSLGGSRSHESAFRRRQLVSNALYRILGIGTLHKVVLEICCRKDSGKVNRSVPDTRHRSTGTLVLHVAERIPVGILADAVERIVC